MILILSLLGAACAQPNPARFSRGEVEQKTFDRERYECERDARNIRGSICDQMTMMETCMDSKGYTRIPGSANKGSGCS